MSKFLIVWVISIVFVAFLSTFIIQDNTRQDITNIVCRNAEVAIYRSDFARESNQLENYLQSEADQKAYSCAEVKSITKKDYTR